MSSPLIESAARLAVSVNGVAATAGGATGAVAAGAAAGAVATVAVHVAGNGDAVHAPVTHGAGALGMLLGGIADAVGGILQAERRSLSTGGTAPAPD